MNVSRAVLLGPSLADDAKVDHVAQQDGVGRTQDQIDGVVVNLFDLADAGDVNLHRALGLANAVEREDHVVGCEGRAVLKFHALAQLKPHLRGADESPLGGQRRFDSEGRAVARQPFVAVHQDGVGGGVVLRMRVERQDVVLCAPTQGLGLRACGDRQRSRCSSCNSCSSEEGIEFHGVTLLRFQKTQC